MYIMSCTCMYEMYVCHVCHDIVMYVYVMYMYVEELSIPVCIMSVLGCLTSGHLASLVQCLFYKTERHQLKNLIHRTNAPLDPQKDMNAAEDFLSLLLHAHVTAAAHLLQSEDEQEALGDLAKKIVVNFVSFPRCTNAQEAQTCDDGVCAYASELLSLGLLWHGFHDAIKEGDGERIIRYWKFLLVVFKSSNCRNYAKEAVNLLLQYH